MSKKFISCFKLEVRRLWIYIKKIRLTILSRSIDRKLVVHNDNITTSLEFLKKSVCSLVLVSHLKFKSNQIEPVSSSKISNSKECDLKSFLKCLHTSLEKTVVYIHHSPIRMQFRCLSVLNSKISGVKKQYILVI